MNHQSIHKIIMGQSGISLLSYTIGLAVGGILITAMATIYHATEEDRTQFLDSSMLDDNISSAMDLMVGDIRRAGYGILTSTSPASLFTVENDSAIQIGDSGKCILFAYEKTYREGNQVAVVDDEDRSGYRLMCGSIAIKAAPDASCANVSCPCPPEDSKADWNCLTDTNLVNISHLAFDTSDSQCFNFTQNTLVSGLCTCEAAWPPDRKPKQGDRLIEKRLINVAVKGNLITKTDVAMSLRDTVIVANDRIIDLAADCP